MTERLSDLIPLSGTVPVPAAVEPAPSAAAVSPATGQPCSSALNGLPIAVPSDLSAG